MTSQQDWDPVVVRGKPGTGFGTTGKPVQRTPEAAQAIKLMKETDIVQLKQLSHATRQEMMQRRVSLKLTQIQLNQQCGFPAGTIQKIENGQSIPSSSQLSTINRAMKSSLKLES